MGDLTKDFSEEEFASSDGAPMPNEYRAKRLELAQNLQALRDRLGQAINIHSGFRSAAHNATLSNSASSSQHLTARAADISVDGKTAAEVYCLIEDMIRRKRMKQGGLGIYPTHVHYDVRGTMARWEKDAPKPQCTPIPINDEPEEDDMAVIITVAGTRKNYVTNFVVRRLIKSAAERNEMVEAGLPPKIHQVSEATMKAIPIQPSA